MNSVSTLNLTFWEQIATFVDLIPKGIYLLYACLASAVDAMQALVRKLAGLDYYYQTINGNPNLVTGTDPLTEFIYGILGFGDSAPVYQALNTVFWSFAIFGLIVLAVTTMAAIIKSHYNEDSGQTSPWKYIYTAGKAIVTFAIMPVVVILGLQLTSFVLRTLDNITAGSGTVGEVQEMFGVQVTNTMLQEQEITYNSSGDSGDENYTYTNYDLFGSGLPSTTSTFSGMLFNAAAYNANRVRNGDYTLEQARNLITSNSLHLLGDDNSGYGSLVNNDERREYMAGQVDYLFQNNVYLSSSYSYQQLVSNSQDVAPVAAWTDWWAPASVESFTKYNTSILWIFYDLWQFNFIVGFVGVVSAFGIMISIILGLMTRLIKGAALFLVYPALLGLAPLDNFKAFKNWGTSFMQQLMMAFGAILGINLLLLILPYVQSINFFNLEVVDCIVQLVMLITGLLMAKEFITLVNGFAGGASAVDAGDPMKGSFGGKLKQGLKPVANVAGGAVRAGGNLAKGAVVGAGKAVAQGVAARTSAMRANHQARKQRSQAAKATREEIKLDEFKSALQSGASIKGVSKEDRDKYNKEAEKIRNNESELVKQYIKNDKMKPEEAKKKANEETNKQLNTLARTMITGYAESQDARAKHMRIADKAQLKQQDIQDKYKLYKTTDEHGETKYERSYDTKKMGMSGAAKEFGKEFGKSSLEAGKALADGFIKAIKGAGSLLMSDKALAGAKEVLGESLSYKGGPFEEYSKKKKEDKEKLEATEKETKSAQTQSSILGEQTAQREALVDIANSMKSLLKSTETSTTANRATQKAVESLARSLQRGSGNTGREQNN